MQRRPKKGDRVYSHTRHSDGLFPIGHILTIIRDHEFSQAIVLYEVPRTIQVNESRPVLVVDGETHWQAFSSEQNLAYFLAKKEYVWQGGVYVSGGTIDMDTVPLSYFDGNWSSSQGGAERWELD